MNRISQLECEKRLLYKGFESCRIQDNNLIFSCGKDFQRNTYNNLGYCYVGEIEEYFCEFENQEEIFKFINCVFKNKELIMLNNFKAYINTYFETHS